MKKCVLTALLVVLFFPMMALSQKYACVNTDYVLRSIPDYATAQQRLDQYVEQWSKEIADMEDEVVTLKSELEQEGYLLPEGLKKRRKEEIASKEKTIKELMEKRFGVGGDLEKKRIELLKPVQDRVYNTIERIAKEKNYAFIFDKAASPTLLFANKKYDISDDVLEMLGYKASSNGGNGEAGEKPTNNEMRQSGTKR